MRKTFVLGVGAQKSGTTWLRRYLNSFDFSDFGILKEYHVWDEIRPNKSGRVAVNISDIRTQERKRKAKGLALRYCMQQHPGVYEGYFGDLCNDSVWLTGDITPSYSALNASAFVEIRERIESRGFKLKVVFVMRDPVERFWSLTKMHMDKRASLRKMDSVLDYGRLMTTDEAYRSRGDYQRTIGELEKAFTPGMLHYGIFEDMFFHKNISSLCEFLEVPEKLEALNVKRNSSSNPAKMDASLRVAVRTEYDDVYQFCAEKFPQTRDLWAL